MTTPFDLTNNDIQLLGDEAMHELLEKLVGAETGEGRFTRADFHISPNTKAGDGGIDLILDAKKEWDYYGFIPNNKVIFQSKAEDCAETKCKREITNPKRQSLRNKIASGFHYIIFCNKHDIPSEGSKGLTARINGIKAGLKEFNIEFNENQLHFYDLNKIRNWIEDSPNSVAIKIWVKEQNSGVSSPLNLKTFNRWEKMGSELQGEFFKSEKLEQELQNIATFINQRKYLRIVGHCGIGKTRRVYESLKLLSTELQNKVIYCKEQDIRPEELINFCESNYDKEFILIVDDCSEVFSERLHKSLQSNNKAKLITIDYEISRNHYTIELENLEETEKSYGTSKTIEKIIKSALPNISESDLSRASNFCQGYPLLAINLVEALKQDQQQFSIHNLTDREIRRKLLWGREKQDDKKERMISICSLFSRLGFEGIADVESKIICEILGEKFAEDFYPAIEHFKNMRIVQGRGRYVFVAPIPLAINLASDWFKSTHPDKIKNLITNPDLPESLRTAFCKQMRFLDENQKVVDLVGELCGITGPFCNAEVLNSDMGSQCFCLFVEVAPEKTAQSLEYIINQESVEDLRLYWGPGRRNLIWALEKLVFRKETFSRAIKILYKFALAENETWGNNATGRFCDLFHLFLPGTEVPTTERLFILEEAINSGNKNEILLTLKALDHAFETHGTRSMGPEKQGSKTTLQDWRPTREEAQEYILKCIDYLKKIGFNTSLSKEERQEAFQIFCKKIRVLICSFGLIDKISSDILKISKHYPSNNSAILTALSHILRFDLESLGEETVNKVKSLITEILKETENNLDSEFATFISSYPYQVGDFFQKDREINFEESQKLSEKKSEEIAQKFINNPNKVFQSLELFITGNHQNIAIFGRTLGKEFPEIDKLIENSFDIYNQFPNSSPEFMGSLLNGIASSNVEKVESTLELILNHPVLKNHLPYITFYATKASARNLNRIISGIEKSIIPISSIKTISYLGSIIKDLRPQVEHLLNTLLQTNSEGSTQACLSILCGYSWEDRKRLIPFSHFILENFLSIKGLDEIGKSSDLLSDFYALSELLKFFLVEDQKEIGLEMALKFINNITELSINRTNRIHHNNNIKEILCIIFEKYGNEIWPIIQKLLIENDTSKTFFLSELFGSIFNDYDHPEKSPISKISWSTIHDNIKILDKEEQKKICIFLVQSVNLLQKIDGTYQWNEWIKNIINNYPEPEILNNIKSNISSLSCWGGMSQYYQKYTEPLHSLKNSMKVEVKNWASECLLMMEEAIRCEKTREDEFEIL